MISVVALFVWLAALAIVARQDRSVGRQIRDIGDTGIGQAHPGRRLDLRIGRLLLAELLGERGLLVGCQGRALAEHELRVLVH